MKTCPSCGKDVRAERTVCGCGELLSADVTHVQAWETETVFGTRPAPARKRSFSGVIAIVVGMAVAGFALIGIRQDLTSARPDPKDQPATSNVQNPASSDQPDEITPASSSQEGVFVFSQSNRPAGPDRTAHPQNGKPAIQAPAISSPTEPLDAKLTEPSTLPATTTDAAKPDCKPDPTLKRAESPATPNDPMPAVPKPAETSRTYILGPRGGCFFVTPGGGKKYVDRGLCSLATSAAARQ